MSETNPENMSSNSNAAIRRIFFVILAAVASIASGCKNINATLAVRPNYAFKIAGSTNDIPAGRLATTNGWRFVHVAESLYDTRDTNGQVILDQPSQWYLAFPEAKPAKRLRWLAWWSNTIQYSRTRKRIPEICDAAKLQFGVYPSTFEVVNVFDPSSLTAPKDRDERFAATARPPTARLQLRKLSQLGWPVPRDEQGRVDPMWHIRQNYSQLEDALRHVTENHPSEAWRVKIGIIDTGYSGANIATPWNIEESLEADAWNQLSCRLDTRKTKCSPILPSEAEVGHGTGTIGLLAGGIIKIDETAKVKGYEGPLGGVPDARIVPIRVAPWVVSIHTANFAYAIDYASRVKGCDVISMSHGGSPSMMWYDTINSAYWRGTAMIAACGDFLSIGLSKKAWIPVPPSSPIYPAAARRVLGVTGATAENKTYAGPTFAGWLDCVAHFNPFGPITRGSYGADGSWRNFLAHDDFGDRIAAARQGQNRIRPIAAWSPNTPWLVPASEVNGATNVIDLDGGGTSAAAPQVAAAAALWLEFNHEYWTNLPAMDRWQKAEATYQALLRSAEQTQGHHWPDRFLGTGFLKARNALDLSFNEVTNAPAVGKFERFQRSPRDFFDGDKSFDKILSRIEGDSSPEGSVTEKLRNQLKPPPTRDSTRYEGLFRCFYNTRMVEAWHKGKNPNQRQRARFEIKSRRDADEAQ